jgi:hypothetical protein
MRTLTTSDSLLLGYREGTARRPGVAVAQNKLVHRRRLALHLCDTLGNHC